jgi:bifunctional non-homologous end joining protein LigD
LPNSSQKLSLYTAKRNPTTTNEPFGPEPAYSGESTSGAFVVHLHDARRRHYDLRLEVGGVLKSFAVPRGPSLSPLDRRLAVETEDHPMDYLMFEAVIPAGNYGAGPMIVWDSGTVRYLGGSAELGLLQGKLDFELTGHKLRGRFALARTRKTSGSAESAVHDEGERGAREWLLLKKGDAHARDTAITEEAPRSVLSGLTVDELRDRPAQINQLERRAEETGAPRAEVDASQLSPMLCASAEQAVDRPDFLYELKLDGFRIVAEKRDSKAELYYRGRGPASAAFPEVVRAIQALPARRLVLDGELICLDERGRPSFERLLGRTGLGPRSRATSARGPSAVRYVVFDLLALGPFDLRRLPLMKRKDLLAQLVRGQGTLRALEHVMGSSRALLEFCAREELEGIVAKRANSAYVAGPRRSGDWIKVKRVRDEEFVVVGMTRGSGARAALGALDVAYYRDGSWLLCGRVGSGLDERSVDQLLARLGPLVSPTATAIGEPEPAPRGRSWLQPLVVVAVRFSGFTDQGRLRHAVFRGIRDEVPATDCVTGPKTLADAPVSSDPIVRADAADDVTGKADAAPAPLRVPAQHEGIHKRVVVSNPKKTFWPDSQLTKRDLCDYYERIGPVLLPHLEDRPVVLVRYPDGIAGKSFYQWNVPRGTPSWVKTIEVARDEEGESRVQCFLINDPETLLYIANLGCIPIHVLAARAGSLDRCDFLTFDFDIGEQPFAHAVELCLALRALLSELGLTGYPKTSGQSGLHVLVPLGAGIPFPVARVLIELLGRMLEQRHARTATMERRIQERGARVYIDTGQTGRSRTIVSPYSVRAQPGAPVSTPLLWDEVSAELDPRGWSLTSVPGRVAQLGRDPMAGLLRDRPDVARAVELLEAKLKTDAKARRQR